MKVHEALSAVMADVRAVGKDGFNKAQGFNFRGVDGVVNAVGPVLRTHGVLVTPRVLSKAHRDFETTKGALMHEAIVEVEYTFTGPEGDTLVGSSIGESADSGDKATAKAMSVAYRTWWLQALCIPTDEPDPDETTVERAAPQEPANIVAQRTLLAEVKQANPDHGNEWAKDCARDIWDKHGQDPKNLPAMIAEVKS